MDQKITLQRVPTNPTRGRHCNESEKFAAKEERREALEIAKEDKHGGHGGTDKAGEIHNKA
jgi:hypothetical protein